MSAVFPISLSRCKIKGGKHIEISDLLSPLLSANTSAAKVETNCRPIAPPGNVYSFPLNATVLFQIFSHISFFHSPSVFNIGNPYA